MLFNSLKLKIVGLIALIVIVIISIATWFTYNHQKKVLLNAAEKSSVILVESLLSSIHSAMDFGHSSEVNNILSRIKSSDQIKALRIVTDDGKILNSTNPAEIGLYLSSEERYNLKSHLQDRFHFINENNTFDSYSKIPNAPECHGCHSASQAHIAHLETELYLNNLTQSVKNEQFNSIASAITIIMLIIGGFKYMTSAGNPESAAGAQKTITYAIAGIVIVAMAFWILVLVQYFTGAQVTIFRVRP